ncbi:hypothetical protein BGZ67_000795 [Mortierella alpina]|nr:hypothetical protein BGZ67_000795 [Mortierella alpina]
MKYTTVILAACIALVQAAPLVPHATNGKPIPDSYIVVLKSGQTANNFVPKFNSIGQRHNGRGQAKPKILKEFKSFPGFHATINAAALKEIQASPEVDYIEQDAIITINAEQAKPPSWGLTRVSQKDLDLTQPFVYDDAAGSGVTAYIVDTGIYAEHSEFKGRAKFGANFIQGSEDTDENGHGSGATSGVVSGMDWVAEHATAGKSVVNMSLGGGKSKAIDDAAGRLFAKNIPLIVAAGNDENVDACDGSPSGAQNALTVAASDKEDQTASFTSYGKCVEIFAPGVDITSSWIGGASAKNTISGTSMATPHVVGVAALYLAAGGLDTAQAVFDKLIETATEGKIQGELKGSPNKLVFSGNAGGGNSTRF